MSYDSSMKTCTFLTLVTLAALTLPLRAPAATPAPTMATCPITIRSLEITEPIVDPDRGRHPGTDDITFRNARTVAASHVTFAFYAKQNFVKSAVTKGLFSPGIDIRKAVPGYIERRDNERRRLEGRLRRRHGLSQSQQHGRGYVKAKVAG
jgi:hypothetical protein